MLRVVDDLPRRALLDDDPAVHEDDPVGDLAGNAAAAPGRTPPRPLTREYSALRFAGINVNDRVPLKRAGVRIGLHAKSLVIDERIGVIGTHNFDPRGDHYNTESAVVIHDAAFAQALARSRNRGTESWLARMLSAHAELIEPLRKHAA